MRNLEGNHHLPKASSYTSHSTSSVTSGVFSACGSLWMGADTCEVPLELFRLNRNRLCKRLKSLFKDRPFVFLEGGREVPFYNTDTVYHVFRQESYFMWTFGVLEPNCYGAIDVPTGTSYLFVPRILKNQFFWKGINSLDSFSSRYNMRNVHYVDEMANILYNLHPSHLLILKGVNSDSGRAIEEAYFPGMEEFTVDKNVLFKEMTELRVIKTDLEIGVLKYVNEVSSAGHRKAMRFVKGGNKYEYQCESEFLHHCYSVGGCRQMAYTCCCASEANTAVMHYGQADAPNDRFILPGEMCLFDMGASYFGYCSDITCSFPVSGKFTDDQKLIYEAVLEANTVVFRACKPGVSWADMHLLALKTLLTQLVNTHLLVGDPEAMVDVGLGAIFMPHGVGHLLGLDVHDVGGYMDGQPPRRGEPMGIDKLRTARVLKEKMVMTIGPGCYFVETLLNEALEDPVLSKFIVVDAMDRFRGFGGVRIEDDVVITKDGAENLTKVPRTVKEIEKWMAGKDDKKYKKS